MKKSLRVVLAVTAMIVAMPKPSSAGFAQNYSEWKTLTPTQRDAYAAGLFNMSTHYFPKDYDSVAVGLGVGSCGIELKLSGQMIAEAITKFYEDNIEKWGQSTVEAFYSKIVRGACLAHVNEARALLGLTAWAKD